jgi:hypothetical protein
MVHMPRYALSGGLLRQVAKGLVPVLPRPACPSPRAAARSPIPAFRRKPFAAPRAPRKLACIDGSFFNFNRKKGMP